MESLILSGRIASGNSFVAHRRGSMQQIPKQEEEQHVPKSFIGRVAVLGLLTVLYFYAGKLGLSLAFINPSATAVWPPAGMALAAFLILGDYVWPAILLGAFLVNFMTSGSA